MSARIDNHDAHGQRRWYQSIAAKLQIAFGLIVALTVGASLLAIVRFNDTKVVIGRLTDEACRQSSSRSRSRTGRRRSRTPPTTSRAPAPRPSARPPATGSQRGSPNSRMS